MRLRTKFETALYLVAACVAIVVSPLAGARSSEARDVGSDHFATGSSVRVDRAVAGDLLAAGGQVDVATQVRGDAIVAGGNLRLGGNLGKSVYAAGGQLTLAGAVANNIRAAGGEVILVPGAEVGGNASLAGGRVEVAGVIKGYLQAAGGELFINGAVGGDVMATAERVELGPQARIAGRLKYASRGEAVIDPAAQIAGGVERTTWRASAGIPSGETARRVGRGVAWVWTLGLMVLAAVLVALLPTLSARVAMTARKRAGWSALAGFIALVCIPVAAMILVVTLIGLPLGLVLLFAFFALLPVGYVVAAVALGDGVLERAKPAASAVISWRVGAAALAVLVLALLARVPYLGVLVALAALLIGLGAMVLQLRRSAGAV
jgi:cytoskeletal protein CcmA (bactofilin family)